MNEIREKIYNFLVSKNWDMLLDYEKTQRKVILEDEQIKKIYEDYFLAEYIKYIESLNNKLDSLVELRRLYGQFIQLHKQKIYSFKEKDFEKFIEIYLKILNEVSDSKVALTIAKQWNHLEISKIIISKYDEELSLIVNHNYEEQINVKINIEKSVNNYSINLFKSNQEVEFFKAFIDVFPHYFTYPNVALSCLIDFDKIKDTLSKDEKIFFFTAIVDCVVFEQVNNNYLPKYFFELDSFYHDNKQQHVKDKMKDNIFSVAGLKLLRIRAKNNNILTRNDFTELIKNIIKEN
ncbi:hypothetical protein O8C97_06870 [Aliarcobacter butzleri]|uniref:hypothetical protein n=1 Tax=Aliarcobacter butzleri TaxID=28197 RepID=UPI00263E2687|nr:hypothetical protein [Aliarcobacter butzleri]MDN5047560.1 hypothetical protein [Aliarcobacter butzleri]